MNYDEFLVNIKLKGEISNFKLHSSGHMYFSLKDDKSKIKCVMFRGNNMRLDFLPADGMDVVVEGRVGIYEKNGEYQVYVEAMQKDGMGALFEKYTALLNKLKNRGYFEESVKKPIPFLPKTAAVVTSPTGAAVRDIISVIKRRCPITEVIVCPVLVQGDGAAADMAAMLTDIDKRKLADVIIIGRGGGSIEELWAFNEEILAESIHNCVTPVICGVGHETDYTIADFVADIRAATPSAAAELAVPDLAGLRSSLAHYTSVFGEFTASRLRTARRALERTAGLPCFADPYMRINDTRQTLDRLGDEMAAAMRLRTERGRAVLDKYTALLNGLSPDNVLRRGYFAVKSGTAYLSGGDICTGDKLTLVGSGMTAAITVDDIKRG